MALTDLLQNRFTRMVGTLAALAVPLGLACEAEEGDTNNYYDNDENGGSNTVTNTGGNSSTLCKDYCNGLADCCERERGIFSDYCDSMSQCYPDCEAKISDPYTQKEAEKFVSSHNSTGCCRFDENGQCKSEQPSMEYYEGGE